jgi:hypothetical protein
LEKIRVDREDPPNLLYAEWILNAIHDEWLWQIKNSNIVVAQHCYPPLMIKFWREQQNPA